MTLPHQLSPRARALPSTPDGFHRFSRLHEIDRSDRTLAVAFVLSIGVHIALIALYAAFGSITDIGIATPPGGHHDRTGRITWSVLGLAGPRDAESGKTPAVSTTCPGRFGKYEARTSIGVPVAVADPRIDSVVDEHPATGADRIGALAMREGQTLHTGLDPEDVIGDPPLDDFHRDAIRPDPVGYAPTEGEFFDGVEPRIDLDELRRNMVYPDLARREEVEGLVVVKVLVDEQGRASVVKVEMSDSRLLDQAALDAVRKTRFTPGSRLGNPVPVWVTIPVKFELR